MNNVQDIARQMTKINDEQTANLTTAAEKIMVMMETALPELASQLSRMSEENKKQRKQLTDLQSHMEKWGAEDENATRQLQQLGNGE
jgi:hypothetical protein